MSAAFIAIILPAESTGQEKTPQPNRTFCTEVKHWKVPAQRTLAQAKFGAQSISSPSFTSQWCGPGNLVQTFPNHGKWFALAIESFMDIQMHQLTSDVYSFPAYSLYNSWTAVFRNVTLIKTRTNKPELTSLFMWQIMPLKGQNSSMVSLFLSVSLCLRQVPCEKQQDPAHSINGYLKEHSLFFQYELFSSFASLLFFKMRNTDACLVLGRVLESMDSNHFLSWNCSGKKTLKHMLA